MVSGLQQNVGFQGINTMTNAAPYMAAPYQYTAQPQVQQPQTDTVEIAGKKKSGSKKGVIGAVVAALVAAGGLFAAVRTGKLTGVANPSSFVDKLQNYAFKGGLFLENAVDTVTQKIGLVAEKVGGWLGSKKGNVAEAVKKTVA